MENKKRRRLPSPAMLVAVFALVAALGGSAYAATVIRSSDIKNGTIRTVDLKNGSVKGQKVAERTLNKVPAARVADRVKGGLPDPNEDNDQVRWFLLGEDGTILDQSGGFTELDVYDTNTNAYIDAGEDLSGKGFSATIAVQNQINGGNTAGEVSVSKCQLPGAVECAPPSAKNDNALVVSPRNSDGTPAATASTGTGTGTATKRVYVTVTETNDDYTEGR